MKPHAHVCNVTNIVEESMQREGVVPSKILTHTLVYEAAQKRARG